MLGIFAGECDVNHDYGAFRIRDLRLRGIAAFGFAGFRPAPIGARGLAGGVEAAAVRREGQRDGRAADRNFSEDRGGFEALATDVREVDYGDRLRGLFADEE